MDFADISICVILGVTVGPCLLMAGMLIISCIKGMIEDYKDDRERRKNAR